MIPVQAREEPPDFDRKVRRRGQRWLKNHLIPLSKKLDRGTKIEPYWRDCLDDLHSSYQGTCAYLCVFIERCTGGVSVDHFVPKSRRASQAYEWDNYRLACSTMNARKTDFSDVLDPFELLADTFRLELVTGSIYVNPNLNHSTRRKASDTIKRLQLDSAACREMRARHYQKYRQERYPQAFLRSYSPFVWAEAQRQGLL